jgi:outer membrane protein assembly factor BamD (BamD/ComL family)
MALYYQRDGSVVMTADGKPAAAQTVPAGATQAQVDAAYAAFLAANPPPLQTVFTPEQFISLFTTAEQAAIVAALPASPALFVWYSKMLTATTIDVTKADTVAAVNALAAVGVITTARAAAIVGGA